MRSGRAEERGDDDELERKVWVHGQVRQFYSIRVVLLGTIPSPNPKILQAHIRVSTNCRHVLYHTPGCRSTSRVGLSEVPSHSEAACIPTLRQQLLAFDHRGTTLEILTPPASCLSGAALPIAGGAPITALTFLLAAIAPQPVRMAKKPTSAQATSSVSSVMISCQLPPCSHS